MYWSKFKASADKKLKIAKLIECVMMARLLCFIERKCVLAAFYPVPTILSNVFFFFLGGFLKHAIIY